MRKTLLFLALALFVLAPLAHAAPAASVGAAPAVAAAAPLDGCAADVPATLEADLGLTNVEERPASRCTDFCYARYASCVSGCTSGSCQAVCLGQYDACLENC